MFCICRTGYYSAGNVSLRSGDHFCLSTAFCPRDRSLFLWELDRLIVGATEAVMYRVFESNSHMLGGSSLCAPVSRRHYYCADLPVGQRRFSRLFTALQLARFSAEIAAAMLRVSHTSFCIIELSKCRQMKVAQPAGM